MQLSITTPTGALIDTEVDEVIAPGVLGEFGVLPGHVPFLSALRPGVLVYRIKDASRVVAVGAGMLEVVRSEKGDRVLVLVDRATGAREVDRDAAAKELAAADAELAGWQRDLGG